MAKKLEVPYEDALALLADAGVKGRKWDREKVQAVFDALPEKVKPEDVKDDDLKELYKDACKALKKGGVEVGEPSPKEAPPKKPKQRRPGICKAAMELLEAASEKKPLTRDKLYELLVKKFPDHPNPESMRSTADRAPYWIPYYFEADVHKSPRGYWLTRSYEGEYRRVKVEPKRRRKSG